MQESQDEKAFRLLEASVNRAQSALEKTKHFQPFLLLLNEKGVLEFFDNEEQDSAQSYHLLEELLRVRIKENDVEVLVLAVETTMPETFDKDTPSAIRLHLEEKSQLENKIGARFIYVPYTLCTTAKDELSVKLFAPVAVGLRAEYIIA